MDRTDEDPITLNRQKGAFLKAFWSRHLPLQFAAATHRAENRLIATEPATLYLAA